LRIRGRRWGAGQGRSWRGIREQRIWRNFPLQRGRDGAIDLIAADFESILLKTKEIGPGLRQRPRQLIAVQVELWEGSERAPR